MMKKMQEKLSKTWFRKHMVLFGYIVLFIMYFLRMMIVALFEVGNVLYFALQMVTYVTFALCHYVAIRDIAGDATIKIWKRIAIYISTAFSGFILAIMFLIGLMTV